MFKAMPDSVINQIYSAAEQYFLPAINFILSQVSTFLSFIENRWYLVFTWYLINTAFIVWCVGSHLFDWRDIIREGNIDIATSLMRKDKHFRESEERYQRHKAESRAEAEERYQKRKSERENYRNINDNKYASYDIEKAKERIKNRKLVYHSNHDDNASYDIEKAKYKARYGPIDISKREE